MTKIDDLDKKILNALLEDGRVSFTELAEKLGVSHGTIHVRVNKLKEAGIISGITAKLDAQKLGYQVSCFMGVKFVNTGDYASVLTQLKSLPPVCETYFTTGPYNVLLKVICQDMDHFHRFLVHSLQPIKEIQSTETLIILDQPIKGSIPL